MINWSALAMVKISFPEKMLADEELQALEELLRADRNVDNLLVHNRRITFYIWGKERINYNILDKIKDELEEKRYPRFVISADEYTKAGQKYNYKGGRT